MWQVATQASACALTWDLAQIQADMLALQQRLVAAVVFIIVKTCCIFIWNITTTILPPSIQPLASQAADYCSVMLGAFCWDQGG